MEKTSFSIRREKPSSPADFEQVAAVFNEKLEKIINKWPDHKERLLKKDCKKRKGLLNRSLRETF